MVVMKKGRTYQKLWIIFLIFFVLKISLFVSDRAYFDEGIYIGMSKYFSSLGKIGYFEPIRPLGLPFILTPFMLLNQNSLLIGRIVSMLLMFLSIYIVYKVGKIHFGKNSGFFSAYLLATSSLIVLFGGYLLTDILAYTLAMLGTSYVLKRKYALSGLITGIAFLIRFPAIIISFPIILYLLIKYKKDSIRPVKKFSIGLMLIITPYFLFNLLYYKGPLFDRLFLPLIGAIKIVQNETWMYPKSNLIKFISEIVIYNFFSTLIVVLSSIYLFKNHRHKLLLFMLSILSILFYFSYRVKIYDVRYTLFVIPFLVILAGPGLSNFIQRKPKILIFLLLFILLIPGLIIAYESIKNSSIKHDKKIESIIKDYNGKILVTNSAFVLFYSNAKTDVYPGPNLGNTYLKYFMNKDVGMFILNPDEYLCPSNDNACKIDFIKRINFMISNNNILYCSYFHNTKIIIISKNISNSMSKEQCLNNIGYEIVDLPKSSLYVRISNIEIGSDGTFLNEDFIKSILFELEKKNIKTILMFFPSNNSITDKNIGFINSLNSDFEFGVVYNNKEMVKNFVNYFNYASVKKITVVSPKDDEWAKKDIEIPKGVGYCLRGPWDSSIVPLPCKKVSIYTIENQSRSETFSLNELKSMYESIKNLDYDIVIDIPADSLSNKKNFGSLEEFIDHL